MKLNILGTEYSITRVNNGQDDYMDSNHLDGYCSNLGEIVVLNLRTHPDWKDSSDAEIEYQEKETLRHEIIHAFLNESGLQWSSSASEHWAKNEEMVDWLAIQSPKIFDAFKAADAL